MKLFFRDISIIFYGGISLGKKIKPTTKVGNLVKYVDEEFFECIYDLLESEEVQNLENYMQHRKSTRLEHCLNVAYFSFKTAKKMGYDYRSAARGGLLHDLYFYDWDDLTDEEAKRHLQSHPKIALDNAQKLCELNGIERDIILKHMWPMTLVPPRYKESYVVTMMDKYCAVIEACGYEMGREDVTRTMVAKYALAVRTYDPFVQ